MRIDVIHGADGRQKNHYKKNLLGLIVQNVQKMCGGPYYKQIRFTTFLADGKMTKNIDKEREPSDNNYGKLKVNLA